ncbi:Methyltransferase-like protein 13 [Hondaea fermentalgiana]|uniref:Methyltransferase-like protein 13 n=1 Tax=Hondaea fermentalgiana TaxID=2315210 RepID=A0A2R5GGL5_9STRA|nr:Methyltransferase-like protein 13 [Hondaea fermentalgiana]|eukprot:GBG27793.1 Methyltransferase-like protein 13 [Hondaea fermentalgiana]
MAGRQDAQRGVMPPRPPRGAEDGRAVPLMDPNPEEALKLLPQTHQQFATRTYWDQFFNKLREKDGRDGAFEWYGAWSDFAGQVERMPSKAASRDATDVLVVGCGNSTLSEDMYASGFRKVTSIDFSEVVIDEMRARASDKPGLEYKVMDFLAMDDAWNDQFDMVFDKGALDALMTDASAADQGAKMLAEIERVLRPGGTYLCVTLAQEHILELLMEKFEPSRGFALEIRAFDPEAGSLIAPFLICARKAADEPGMYVFSDGSQTKGELASSREDVESAVDDRRLVYHMQRNIQNMGQGLRARFALWDASSSTNLPRFLVSVVDSGRSLKDAAIACAVFLVPQGREHEWTFASAEGQMQVAKSNGIGRLIVVSLGRSHSFASIEAVQTELSPSMTQLYPSDLDATTKVPYMTLGPDLGTRKPVAKTSSEASGDFMVEDVEVTDESTGKTVTHRRLVFLQASDVIQSEARIAKRRAQKSAKGKKKNAKGKKNASSVSYFIDKSYLAFEFHRAMVSGLCFLKPKDSPARAVVVGLGGGALASYVATQCGWFAPEVKVQAVELDAEVVETAKTWFDFAPKEGALDVLVGDGSAWLADAATSTPGAYEAVFLDVDAKDLTQPVLFPPRAFLEESAIENVKRVLTEEGMLILNLACKSAEKQKSILSDLRKQFVQTLCIPLQAIGDANCIVLAFKGASNEGKAEDLCAAALERAKAAVAGATEERPVHHDFAEVLDDVRVVKEDGTFAPTD